ncbi:hypothetical protein E1B28_006767 [Marasmius oreades]|uniref:Uncharacterized protein n=1 Tax=Marasmius oreades TaxID=181124 RepID=A0A9P7UWS5_9AGAR|nr:uncharacterized protein E1B28_006767 [Marasmius oreades]KAG7096091.1 hypothetical protein E1B28_006767 [Marasmius oreades]
MGGETRRKKGMYTVIPAHNDFWGLPSKPLSIYHTGPAWPLPTGPEGWRVPKEARPVCNHDIASVWHQLGSRIYQYFDSRELKWTSIDPVCFAEERKEPGPLFLWVGVLPGTLSPSDAKNAAMRCKEILLEYEIVDVEIAFRESIFTRFAGGPGPTQLLLDHEGSSFDYNDHKANVRGPFTPALGLQIAPKAFPYIEGTGCLYLCEGGGSDRVFLLTARHVVLPPSEYSNELYSREGNGIPRHEIIHLGGKAFQNALAAIVYKIESNNFKIEGYYKHQLEDLGPEAVEDEGESEDAEITRARKDLESMMSKAERARTSAQELYHYVTSSLIRESERILGHVVYAPPISVGGTADSYFMEDWALIELGREKFDWKVFRGNVIDIGTASLSDFMVKMYPGEKRSAKLRYPYDGLMQLRDFVKDGDLHRPAMFDGDGEPCIMVTKNGAGTGLTFGRSTGIESFVREYRDTGEDDDSNEYKIHSTSREIPVYSYSYKDGAFSAPGDSGSVVADANNRIVGMLIGGTGKDDATDVTYVTPYYLLDERIKKVFPNSHLCPIVVSRR